MSLKLYDYEKLLDDVKLIAKTIRIIRDENNPENRKFACGLTEDLVNRLYRDLQEMRDCAEPDGQTYGEVLKTI